MRDPVRAVVTAAAQVFETPGEFSPRLLQRSLALSTTDYVLTVLGPALEERLRREAPGLDLRYVPNAVDDPERLRRGDTDLAMGIYGELPPELRTRPLLSDRFVCVVRNGHPHIHDRLNLEQFVATEHIQIAPRGQPGGYVDEQLAARGLQRRVVRAVPYFQVALRMTAESDAILTVSERIARIAAPHLGLRIVEAPLPLEPFALSLVWHPRFDADAAHAWFRGQLLECAAALETPLHPGARRRLSATDPTTGKAKRPRRG
jgi:DNA-binding transcriptional LysR family regulator